MSNAANTLPSTLQRKKRVFLLFARKKREICTQEDVVCRLKFASMSSRDPGLYSRGFGHTHGVPDQRRYPTGAVSRVGWYRGSSRWIGESIAPVCADFKKKKKIHAPLDSGKARPGKRRPIGRRSTNRRLSVDWPGGILISLCLCNIAKKVALPMMNVPALKCRHFSTECSTK